MASCSLQLLSVHFFCTAPAFRENGQLVSGVAAKAPLVVYTILDLFVPRVFDLLNLKDMGDKTIGNDLDNAEISFSKAG